MKFIQNTLVFVCSGVLNMHAMDTTNKKEKPTITVVTEEEMSVDDYIQKNINDPKILADLLIEMGRWKEPDLNAARKILTSGVSADAKVAGHFGSCWWFDSTGAAALVTAAGHGHIDYVKLLLEFKANIEIKDPWDGRTALMAAALEGHDAIVAFLLEHKANPNATNCLGVTALHWAASYAKVGAVKLLLNAEGIDVSIKTKDEYLKVGETVLSRVRNESHYKNHSQEHAEIIKLLIEAGAKE
jgi:hypothetical protein